MTWREFWQRLRRARQAIAGDVSADSLNYLNRLRKEPHEAEARGPLPEVWAAGCAGTLPEHVEAAQS